MRAFEVLKELKYEFKGKDLGDNFEIIAHRGKIWAFDLQADDTDEKLTQSLIDNLDLNVGDDYYAGEVSLVSLIDDIRDERPDILYGQIINGKILYIDPNIPGQNPYTSKLIKDVVKFFNLEGVETMDFDEDDTDRFISRNEILGKIPDFLYHGTTSKHIQNIMSKGVMPVPHGNWRQIKFPDLTFWAANPGYALYHAKRQAQENREIPVVIKAKMPDKTKIVLDYDVANIIYGKEHPEVKTLGYGPHIPAYREDLKRTIQQVNKGTDLNTQMGIFGYKGRVPSSMFKSIMYPWDDGWKSTPTNDWIINTNKKEALQNILNIRDYGTINYDELEDEE